MMDRDQFGAIGKRSFDLNTVNHAGNSGHDLVATQNLASEVHELSDAFPLANEFKELGRNQGNGAGIGLIVPPIINMSARQLKRPRRCGPSRGPSHGSSNRESRINRSEPRNTSLRLSKRVKAQRSPRATRPEQNQSTRTSPLPGSRRNSCDCLYCDPAKACTGSGTSTS